MALRLLQSARAPRRSSRRELLPRLLCVAAALALGGCVTTYQPLVSLQRPVAVNPQIANFAGLAMLVRCVPGKDFKAEQAQYLCRRLERLFTNQGAKVSVEVPEPGSSGSLADASDAAPVAPDLVLELTSRQVHYDNNTPLWLISFATLTLVPARTETTVALDVTIREADGFVLVSDSLQARFVRLFGAGFWAVNNLLNWLARDDDQDLGDKTTRKDFSRDVYGQISQLAFHARMRSQVLHGFDPLPAKAPAPAPTAAEPAK